MKMDDIAMETDQIDNVPDNLELEAVAVTPEPENATTNAEETGYQYPALFTSKSLLQLSHSSWSRSSRAESKVQPYLRGCKWSPDGTCCLTIVNGDGMHVTELPRELYAGDVKSNRLIDVLDSVIHVKEAGTMYDFCWYPGMNSAKPETCCWITTRQNGPIQMWDGFDGSLRCSYRGYNSVDELENALSIAFTIDGNSIVAGYKKTLKTFDVERPGRDYIEHRVLSPASCLAMDRDLLAVGSWNTTISLYNITETGTYKSIGKMHGHGGGVTQMRFTPDGQKLVTGARKDHRLLVWDIRYYRRPLNILNRPVSTNQRIYFDISPCGKYLVSGGTDGVVKVWDVNHVDWKNSLDSDNMDYVTHKFPLHTDSCNSLSIHPYRPILATGSGQLHYQDPTASPDHSEIIDENVPKLDSNAARKETQTTLDGSKESGAKLDNIRTKEVMPNRNSVDVATENECDMKYSSYAENSLIFWWTGDVPDLT